MTDDRQLPKRLRQDLIEAVHRRKTGSCLVRTGLFITHDRDMLNRMQPRIIMRSEGRILFDGTYECFSSLEFPRDSAVLRTNASRLDGSLDATTQQSLLSGSRPIMTFTGAQFEHAH